MSSDSASEIKRMQQMMNELRDINVVEDPERREQLFAQLSQRFNHDAPQPRQELALAERLQKLRDEVAVLTEIKSIADENIKRILFDEWKRGRI